MNGRDRTLSARPSEDIIVTSSPGERNVTYPGPVPKQDPSFSGRYMCKATGCRVWTKSSHQQLSHNHASNNLHDSIDHMTNYRDLQLLLQHVPGIFLQVQLHFFSKLLLSSSLLGAKINIPYCQPIVPLKLA